MESGRSEIPGSAPQHSESLQAAVLSPDQQLSASIYLRRAPGSPDRSEDILSGRLEPVSREEAEAEMSADPKDMAAVEAFARQYNLQVTAADPTTRTVKVSGTAQDFDRAFGVRLGNFGNHISYNGPITVPASLANVIVAVLGLDNRPVASPRADAAVI